MIRDAQLLDLMHPKWITRHLRMHFQSEKQGIMMKLGRKAVIYASQIGRIDCWDA